MVAYATSYIDPNAFGSAKSIDWISIVFVGGVNSLSGSVVMACLFSLMTELLRATFPKGKGYHGHIIHSQLHNRDTHQKRREHTPQDGQDYRQQEGRIETGRQNTRHIGPDAHEGGLPHGKDTCQPHQNKHGDDRNSILKVPSSAASVLQ